MLEQREFILKILIDIGKLSSQKADSLYVPAKGTQRPSRRRLLLATAHRRLWGGPALSSSAGPLGHWATGPGPAQRFRDVLWHRHAPPTGGPDGRRPGERADGPPSSCSSTQPAGRFHVHLQLHGGPSAKGPGDPASPRMSPHPGGGSCSTHFLLPGSLKHQWR